MKRNDWIEGKEASRGWKYENNRFVFKKSGLIGTVEENRRYGNDSYYWCVVIDSSDKSHFRHGWAKGVEEGMSKCESIIDNFVAHEMLVP